MCRGDPSAHGRISALLSAGAFPHDLADLPRVGPGRMCSTVRPAPMLHSGLAAPRSVAAPMGLVDPDNPVHPVAWTAGWAAGARSDCRPRSLVCVGRRLTPVRSRSSSERPTRPIRLSWAWFIPRGTRPRGEKWRSGRIVSLRTRPRCRQNRAITRKLPGASGVPTRTILPERHFPPRAVSAGAFSASSGRTPSGTAGRARRTVFSASSGRTAPPWPATAAARVVSASSGHAAPSSRQAGRLLRARGQRLIGSFLSESRNAAPARPGAARTGPGAGVLAVAAVRAGPAAAQVVQICCKGLDLAGAPEENR